MNTPPIVPEDAQDNGKTASPGAANVLAERRTDLWITLLAATLGLSVLVFSFEALKQTLFPHIRIWQSHAVTIVFTSLIAAVITWFALRANERAKEAIWRNEMEFRAIFEQSALGVVQLSLDGHILRCNEALRQMLGYAETDLCGKNIIQFTHPDDLKVGVNCFRELLDGRRTQYQADRRYLCANGSVITGRLTMSVVRGPAGKPQSVVAMIEDLTGNKRDQERLRQLSRAVEQSPLTIVITNPAGEIEYVNPHFTETTGYSAAEALGQNPRILKSGETPPEEYAHLWQTITSGKDWRGEFHNRKKNGEPYWELAAISPIFDDAGKITHFLAFKEDITERKKMDRQLAETLDFNRNIITDVPAGIVVYKASGPCVMANEATARMIQSTVPQLLTQDFRQLESWRASGLLDMAEKTLATREPQRGEFHHVSTFGKEVWVVGHFSCFVRNNEPHLLLTLNDITERKRAEEALTRERVLLRTLIDNLPDCIYAKDAAGRKILANPADLKNLRCQTEAEAIGKTDFDFFPHDIAESFHNDDQKVLQGQQVINREEYVLNEEGERRWLLTSKLPLRDQSGKIVGLVGVGRDITEHKRAAEKIHEQAALLDDATDAIWALDLNEHISYWNKGAESIYGWTAAEAIGKSPVELLYKGIMPPQLRECIKAVKDRGAWAGELEEFTKDGKTVVIQGRANASRDNQGRLKSVLIINTDITEKKKLEAQFLRAQRMESIGALAGGIAHDLNNVLTPLLVSVQLLKGKINDTDGQRLLNALEINIERGAKLVKQVLTFGRGVQGERIPIQPAYIIREIRQIIQETFPKSVEFECDSPAGLWTIIGDSTQLYQVVLNLAVNARDAMPNGGKLSLRLQNVVLDEAYSRMNLDSKPGPFVVFEVTDTGTGIPKEIQDRIFEPFFTTKKPGEGTGLGLSTTLGIVKSHGGFIHCYSEPGKGSTFKVYLPSNAAPPAAVNVAVDQTHLPRGRGELVLLVDDEQAIREVAQKTLERFGYRVLLAANGAEAVSLYTGRRNEIAIVVTDMSMPVMDGPAAIAALQSINPEVKIIGSSGLGSTAGAVKASSGGTGHFIRKPYTTETMLHTLDKVLHQAAAK
ncbi:MAG TPA: PAS domain S-box protein [Alphaproteobacteria bacterium]|nr:PAS domain S-box protein [Alphaproteobacteria bacterium]